MLPPTLITVRWALPRRMRSRRSFWNPLISANAMTSAAVPTATPAAEISVMSDRKALPR